MHMAFLIIPTKNKKSSKEQLLRAGYAETADMYTQEPTLLIYVPPVLIPRVILK